MIKIIGIDDRKTDRDILQGHLTELKKLLGNILEFEIKIFSFEDAKAINPSASDIIFLDMRNDSNSFLHGPDLVQHWITTFQTNNQAFFNRLYLFTDNRDEKYASSIKYPFLNRINANIDKTSSSTKFVEIFNERVLPNLCTTLFLNNLFAYKSVQNVLNAYVSKNYITKIRLSSNDSFGGNKTRDLVYITSKTGSLFSAGTIIHYFSDGFKLNPITEKSKDFNKAFKSQADIKYFQQIFSQGITIKEYEDRLQTVIINYKDEPKVFLRFDKYILNLLYIKECSLEKNSLHVKFIQTYGTVDVPFKSINEDLLNKINKILAHCKEVFEL